uniref:Uncharacterized protein n=1 Tax=Panagrolaimus sp. PS1159 TaxID=55785 RepID=A0AC35G1M6_9BILA
MISSVAGQGIYVTPTPELQAFDYFNNQNYGRNSRQILSSIDSPYVNNYAYNNGPSQRYISSGLYSTNSGSPTLARQNGQIPLNPFERKADIGGFKYPSQFFAAQNAARREEQQNVNKEYVNPGYQYGQYPYGPGYQIKNYVNEGQYRRQPQPYEPEFYTTTSIPLSISQSQNLAQQKENQKWESLRSYGLRNQEPQGLLQEQLREPWNQSYENQPGLYEHVQQIAQRGYGKKK